MDYAVKLEDVYKEYPIYHHITAGFKSFLFNLPRNIASMKRMKFTALKGVSFEVKKGETFGIIGKNGSGKSTMLSLIAGVIKPDRGILSTSGRISSLLELGAGFHPDLSGVENIILNGILMGNTRQEMLKKIDEIIEFSELGDFIYQPLRTYSSGMHVRLGFSVAVHTEPEILLVDEALAVGDLSFQEKCSTKMSEFKEAGTTIIIVSHGMSEIAKLCDRTAWLDKGMIMAIGKSKEVIMKYLEYSASLEMPVPVEEIHAVEKGMPVENATAQIGADSPKPVLPTWWNSPAAARQCELFITGDQRVTFYDFLKIQYLLEKLERGLSICHEFKGIEVDFTIHNICKSFDVIDDEDKLEGLIGGSWSFREQRYDLVLCVDILHRIRQLGPFLEDLRSALRDDGVVIALEYVGPENFRYSDKEMEIARMLYGALREGAPFSASAGAIETSSRGNLFPALESVFDIVDVRYFGGPLYDLLLNKIIDDIDPEDKKGSALVRTVMMFDRILIREGSLKNTYALIVARKKVSF